MPTNSPDTRVNAYKKNSRRNKHVLTRKLTKSSCLLCSSNKHLVAKSDTVNIGTLVDRSYSLFDTLLQKAEVRCRSCWKPPQSTETTYLSTRKLHRCKECFLEKKYNEFLLDALEGRAHKCKECLGKKAKERVSKCLALVAELKTHPCTDCKNVFHPHAMEFDHLPEHKKYKKVSVLAASGNVKRLETEIAKCEVVCANCHRIRTAARREQSQTSD